MSRRCRACENTWCHRLVPGAVHDYIADLDVYPVDLVGTSGDERAEISRKLALCEGFAKGYEQGAANR